MPRRSLVEFFHDLESANGTFLVHDDGFRRRTYTYRDITAAAHGFSARLRTAAFERGESLVIWSENRPEWIAAFWGAILAGVIVVPIDYRSSLDFARRVVTIVGARAILVGDDVSAIDGTEAARDGVFGSALVWTTAEFDWRDARRINPETLSRTDTAEIIFTSGATAEPKGVLITHGNVLANLEPIETEIRKYRRYGRPFFPLRFLNLLPLSHMFGQAMATFIPPLLSGTVVFMRGYNPAEIVSQVKTRRISVVVSVPKILDVLRDHVQRLDPRTAEAPTGRLHVARRWWRFRRIHRAFGLKFWSFIVGAAPLEPATEEFWSRLGFLVIQGYGLTETAPIVSLNHPFSAQKGSVGKAIGGVEVVIAEDGEILVRGENVTHGYVGVSSADASALDADGWLHTGDIGEVDGDGRLYVRGRKKEMIVTPEGLNVFPEDVERVLNALPGVHESAVIGVRTGGEERVHAVVRAEAGVDPDALARDANAGLMDHQRIRRVSIWPGDELPRTEGTRKLKRQAIRDWVETGRQPAGSRPAGDTLSELVSRYASGHGIGDQTTIEELGLSSLERIELLVALEERFHTSVDEERFGAARSVGEIRALVAAGHGAAPVGGPTSTHASTSGREWTMPTWSRSAAACAFRRLSLASWVLPLAGAFARIHVEGAEHLDRLEGPVVFAANHQSHFDTPVILSALPGPRRARLATAMAKEFFDAYFHPEGRRRRERFESGALYALAALFFNAFPLPQRDTGARLSLRYIGELLSDGWSVLIFPEGERTETGAIGQFRPGVGMIASRLKVPVVPVRLIGVDHVLHKSWTRPRRAAVRVIVGPPLSLEGEDYASLAERIERAVRALHTAPDDGERP